eukprot:gene20138-20685_t
MSDVHSQIDAEVKSNDVLLFMKGVPKMPQCGFSGQVVAILDHLGVPFKGVNILESAELRQGGEFVGGCDIVREMFQAGELQTALLEAGVPLKASA